MAARGRPLNSIFRAEDKTPIVVGMDPALASKAMKNGGVKCSVMVTAMSRSTTFVEVGFDVAAERVAGLGEADEETMFDAGDMALIHMAAGADRAPCRAEHRWAGSYKYDEKIALLEFSKTFQKFAAPMPANSSRRCTDDLD